MLVLVIAPTESLSSPLTALPRNTTAAQRTKIPPPRTLLKPSEKPDAFFLGKTPHWDLLLSRNLMPPYNSHLKSIEMAFSKLKAHPRRIVARPFIHIFQGRTEICNFYIPNECCRYFNAEGCAPG